jgi:DNA-directed RNA polymerase alpha subunit
MEPSIKDLLVQAQAKSERNTHRAEFYTEVQRVIKEQADEIAKLKAEAESGGSTDPSAFRKAFLLGAGYGANFQASYVQDEMRDYEADVYTSFSDNGMYADINGTYTLDASDLADHLRLRQINLADLEDIRSFLDMKDEEIMDKLTSVGVGVRTFNLEKSTDNETQQTGS